MNIIFLDTYYVNWTGDDALTFLAIALVFIMLVSLFITNWITTPNKSSEGKAWIPTSTNIKPNLNKF